MLVPKVMPRPLTDLEWEDLSKFFPNLLRDDVTVIDDDANIKNYNCIAWSLGCTDRWLSAPSVLSAFKDRYEDRGGTLVERLSDNAGIDGWGQDRGLMVHASRFWEGSWTSKISGGLCITHGREGLTGNSPAYGQILASFLPLQEWKWGNPTAGFLSSDEKTIMLPDKLASQNILGDLREKFETAFGRWKSTWFEGNMAVISDMKSRAWGDAFDELASMDERIIIPLVIEKLADPDNFMALVLYEKVESNLRLQEAIKPGILESEQARSQRVVKLWLYQ